MPPKKSKGKGKKTKRVVEDREKEREELGERDEDREDRDEHEGGGDEEGNLYELFDKIVSFFADRPYFFDVGDEHYCNKKRKDAELAEFAHSINWTRKYLVNYV